MFLYLSEFKLVIANEIKLFNFILKILMFIKKYIFTLDCIKGVSVVLFQYENIDLNK